ncbi:MAG: flagellar motor switch protein FliN [Bryobacteraceae bacterium]
MSPAGNTRTNTFDANARVAGVLNQWAESLAQVLDSMTDQRPQIAWQAVSGAAAEVASGEYPYLWWEHPFSAAAGAVVWIGSPQPTWERVGTLTLKAAGLDTVAPSEAQNTWFEIVGQSLSAMARSISGLLGREITCGAGAVREAAPEATEWASVSLTFADGAQPPLLVALGQDLQSLLTAPPPGEIARAEPAPVESWSDAGQLALNSRTIGLLLDVDLPVSISFGRTRLPMKEVLKLSTGSIVELDRDVNDPVEVRVNQHLIARGEVVVVEGNYGVRIQEIASRNERLRSIP